RIQSLWFFRCSTSFYNRPKILHQNNVDIIKLSCRDMTQYISNAECDDFRFLEVQEESDFQKEDNLYQAIQDFDLPDFPTMPYAEPYCNMQQPKDEYIMDQKIFSTKIMGHNPVMQISQPYHLRLFVMRETIQLLLFHPIKQLLKQIPFNKHTTVLIQILK
ncbi:MAG: hypothetical protein LUG26_03870, partial [Ruminococcus sp.]|nr:hypothetical protein [Ruminococcus sp.]